MQKHLSFKIQRQPTQTSPDCKRTHLVKQTQSPVKQIQKFLMIKQKSMKIIPTAEKSVPTNDKNSYNSYGSYGSYAKNGNGNGSGSGQGNYRSREEQYKSRIKELEGEVVKYKGYFQQCRILTQKNLVLKQQIQLIVQELENRYDEGQLSPTNSTPTHNPLLPQKQSLHTLQSSIQAPNNSLNSTLSPHPHFFPSSPSHKSNTDNSQIQQLHNYISSLQSTLKQVVQQSHKFKTELKKQVKKDMNQMQQKLMTYILGLEDKVSQATFRNFSVMKNISSGRNQQGEGEAEEGREGRGGDRYGNTQRDYQFGVSDRSDKNAQQYNKLNNRNQMVGSKKDSVISMMNLQISSSSNTQKQNENSGNKKQVNSSLKKGQCQSCISYINKIDMLTDRCNKLQQQIKKYKTQSQHIIKKATNSALQKNITLCPQPATKKLQSRLALLQSDINILVESSQSQHSGTQLQHKQAQNQNNNQPQLQISQKQQSQQNRIQKIKQQLVNIMQDLQNIVHQCQYYGSSSNKGIKNVNAELNGKVREQGKYIGELEEEVTRLRMEVEEGKSSREKLEKFMKLQVREQQEIQSPYFRTIKQPISCIDHNATKGKINHILTQIKKFQFQVQIQDKQQTTKKQYSQQPLTF